MKEIELKPCPFCGGKDITLEYWDSQEGNTKTWEECDDDNGATFPFAVCRECECQIIFSGCVRGKEVINAWNRRADDEQREAD